MPKMISLRDFDLRSVQGLSVSFIAGEPTFVPDTLVPEAMEKGCVPADLVEKKAKRSAKPAEAETPVEPEPAAADSEVQA